MAGRLRSDASRNYATAGDLLFAQHQQVGIFELYPLQQFLFRMPFNHIHVYSDTRHFAELFPHGLCHFGLYALVQRLLRREQLLERSRQPVGDVQVFHDVYKVQALDFIGIGQLPDGLHQGFVQRRKVKSSYDILDHGMDVLFRLCNKIMAFSDVWQ